MASNDELDEHVFISQEVKMRLFSAQVSVTNKSKTTLGNNFSNLKKTRYHEQLGQNENKTNNAEKYFLSSNQKNQ